MGERQFGPYRLVHQIAVGGMAEIHLAKTGGIAGFEKYVALKMIHPNFSQDESFIQMLIDEAKITVQLQHVNVAQTFDLGRVGDTYYITMEYVDGSDLYQILRRGSEQDIEMPADIAAFIAKEVATGLDYAHRKRDHSGMPLGIVHRDVSPQNVLISHSGEVKLVDFGIAKATMRARQTAVGVIKGKYYYMSPEQAWGDPLDHRTDIFSAGILLYEMLVGQMLYLEEDMRLLLDMVRKADIPPPTTLRPGIPPQLERIVMHALQKRADDRYRTAADFAADLERFLHVYSPVFSASKLARYAARVMGEDEPAPPVIPAEPSEGHRSARYITKQLSRQDFVRDRSEFTDENSVIFRMSEMAAMMSGGDTDVQDAPEPDVVDVPSSRLPAVPPSSLPRPRLPSASTRQMDEFSDDRTIVDDGPPGFGGVSAEVLRDDFDTADEQRVGDLDTPTVAIDKPVRPGARFQLDEDALDAPTQQRPTIPLLPQPDVLAARNPRPAVSAVREPRRSRRTPARGVPMPRGGGSVISKLIDEAIDEVPRPHTAPLPARGPADDEEFETVEQPRDRVRQAVEAARGERAVHTERVPPLPPPAMPLAAPPAPFAVDYGRAGPLFTTQQQRLAYEIDALPDQYKVSGPRVPRWLLPAVFAAACVAAGIIIGLIALGDDAPPPTASINVVSIPPGAEVIIDGVRQDGRTPMNVEATPGAEHHIVVEAPGHERWEGSQLIPTTGGAVKVVAALRRVSVTLVVESTPSNAEVFLNGLSRGRTPLTLQRLDPTTATVIELRAEGYRPERRTLDWKGHREHRLQFELKR